MMIKGWTAAYNGNFLHIAKSEAENIEIANLIVIHHFGVPKSKRGGLIITPVY